MYIHFCPNILISKVTPISLLRDFFAGSFFLFLVARLQRSFSFF